VGLLADDGVDIAVQKHFCLTFVIHEHHSVTELRVAGDDASADDDGLAIEPEFGFNAATDGERHHQLDVTAAAAEVGGFEAQGDVAAFLMEFDLDLDGAAGIAAAIVFSRGGCKGLGIKQIHRSYPGLAPFNCQRRSVLIVLFDHRQCGRMSLGRESQADGYVGDVPAHR
jgi:hypothetical protein